MVDDDEGEPLSIGRKSRVIPPALRRALRFRDDGCRFPHASDQYVGAGQTGRVSGT